MQMLNSSCTNSSAPPATNRRNAKRRAEANAKQGALDSCVPLVTPDHIEGPNTPNPGEQRRIIGTMLYPASIRASLLWPQLTISLLGG